MIEGMIRFVLYDDYYILDEKSPANRQAQEKRYRIGDRVKVKVFKVDKEIWIDLR
jgi:exoribonuclease R